MCKRTTKDPLVRLFLDRWGLNPIGIPHEHAAPGQLWIKRGRQVSGPMDLNPLLLSPIELPSPRQERLTEMEATSSHGYDTGAGLGLLEAFLAGIGAGAVVQRVRAGYEQQQTRTVKLRFGNVTRIYMDLGTLGVRLRTARFDPDHSLVHPDNHRFIASAIVRSPSISVTAEDDRHKALTLEAGVLAAVDAHAKVGTQVKDTGEVTYTGDTALAIGVALHELRPRADGSLGMGLPGTTPMRAGRPLPPAPVFLGDDEDALIMPTPVDARGNER